MSDSATVMQIKAKARNLGREWNIHPQVVLQNFMTERFLARLADSPWRNDFVIKGGTLISAIVGLQIRTTMDMDTTLRHIPLDRDNLLSILEQIGAMDKHDAVSFHDFTISEIRKADERGGLRVKFTAIFESLVTPLSLDVTTGDAILPPPKDYSFKAIFVPEGEIKLVGYAIETILADKVEAILNHGVFGTRPRDFYDIHILTHGHDIDYAAFKDALFAIAAHHKTTHLVEDAKNQLSTIFRHPNIIGHWQRYQKLFPYANTIPFDAVTTSVMKLLTQSGITAK